MRIGVLTSGGDAPGMNAAIRSVVKAAVARGHTAVGIRNGYEGLLEGQGRELSLPDVDGLSRLGGTRLGSARSKRFPTSEGQALARQQVVALGLDALVVIGGNGSLAGAHALGTGEPGRPCQVVGLPASIDNDIGFTRLSIGVDTAVNTIVEACDRISDTAAAHRRAFVVEVMGRHCGYLAMRAGIAADADAILFGEAHLSKREILTKLEGLLARSFAPERGKLRVLVMKAENVDIPTSEVVGHLRDWVDAHVPGVSVRETILGHVVRGGSPSAVDRLISQRLAVGAVLALEQGAHDEMMAWDAGTTVGQATVDPSVRRIGLTEVLAETHAMLEGHSAATRARVELLNQAEQLLAL
ncbi:MAG: 6-phosphofructokinase [Myxococcales bacterium]|nr:6-phosphofructokinase [Myxococcales bacterium]